MSLYLADDWSLVTHCRDVEVWLGLLVIYSCEKIKDGTVVIIIIIILKE